MFLLDRLPMDPFVHPMAPVLSDAPWLAIHVPIIMVGSRRSRSRRSSRTARRGAVPPERPCGRAEVGGHPVLGTSWSDRSCSSPASSPVRSGRPSGAHTGAGIEGSLVIVAFLAYIAILHARSDGLNRRVRRRAVVPRRLLDHPRGVPRRELRARHGHTLAHGSNIVRSMLMVGGVRHSSCSLLLVPARDRRRNSGPSTGITFGAACGRRMPCSGVLSSSKGNMCGPERQRDSMSSCPRTAVIAATPPAGAQRHSATSPRRTSCCVRRTSCSFRSNFGFRCSTSSAGSRIPAWRVR